jgi:hypothetical protein
MTLEIHYIDGRSTKISGITSVLSFKRSFSYITDELVRYINIELVGITCYNITS